jgi:hypothetical protein
MTQTKCTEVVDLTADIPEKKRPAVPEKENTTAVPNNFLKRLSVVETLPL